VRRVSERAGEAMPQRQAHDRHPGLEDPEHDADSQPGAVVDPRDADGDRRGEIRQAYRDGDQQHRKHAATVHTDEEVTVPQRG
jgi:hypothetical protein